MGTPTIFLRMLGVPVLPFFLVGSGRRLHLIQPSVNRFASVRVVFGEKAVTLIALCTLG